MDILTTLYKIQEYLNKNSGVFSKFTLEKLNGFDYKINYNYHYNDKIKEEITDKQIVTLYSTKDLSIICDYKSLEDVDFLVNEIGYDTLFSIEKIINDYEQSENDTKTKKLYILKANYSQSVLMEKFDKDYRTFELNNIHNNVGDNYKFIFNLEEIKKIDSNKNIIYDYYIEDLDNVLSDFNPKTFKEDTMYQFSETQVIDTSLFDNEDSVDYYNTVTTIKRLVDKYVDNFKNKVVWQDNLLFINDIFILEFYETHMGYKLDETPNEVIQEKLYDVLFKYNESPHKITDKYVIIDNIEKCFLQSSITPVGEFNILPLLPIHIQEFDENCIFYLEEIHEKFSTELLSSLYSDNSKYEIVLWDKIDDHREQLFNNLSDKEYSSIIKRLNSISKRVV